MQTVSFQQSSRASSNPMIFPCHQSESAAQDIDHRDICSAVRAWAAAEGRVAVALQIQEAAENFNLMEWISQAGRCLEREDVSLVGQQRRLRIVPKERRTAGARDHVCITTSIPRPCRKERLVCLPDGQLEKEVSEAKQALMLDAPKKEKLKELGEGF